MMRKSSVWCVSTLVLLTGCATGPKPQVVVQEVCPKIPALELNLTDGALEHDFIGTMQQFLLGKLPWPPNYSLRSEPALQTGPRLNGL